MINKLESVFIENCYTRIISNECICEGLNKLTVKGGRIPIYLILNSKEKNILTPIGKIEDL